jgi:hypothetical protein
VKLKFTPDEAVKITEVATIIDLLTPGFSQLEHVLIQAHRKGKSYDCDDDILYESSPSAGWEVTYQGMGVRL